MLSEKIFAFAHLADQLHRAYAAKIVLLGSEGERPIADAIVSMLQTKPLDLVGKTSVGELAALMQYLKVVVTNDGGPLHMAVALGIPTVSLFGPVDECVYGPYPASLEHRVITKCLPCRPCYQNFRMSFCERQHECIKSIDIEDVFKATSALLRV